MKSLKMLGLAAIAAGALMAFAGAGTASATELTCTNPPGTKVMCEPGTMIHAESEGHAVLDPPIGKIECVSTVTADTLNTGGAGETVEAKITSLTFTGCTNGATVTVLERAGAHPTGTLTIHTTEEPINNLDGTLTSTGTEVTVESAGFHCIFSTNNTDIGDLTGSSKTKATPTLDISASISRTGGRSGAFCGTTASWTGSYKITEPDWMDVH